MLRNRETSPVDFRRVMEQLSALLAYEIAEYNDLYEARSYPSGADGKSGGQR